jgi:hypothetical protein
MRKLIMSLATFSTVVSSVVVATALTMTSLALIRLSSRDRAKLPPPTTAALMWINAEGFSEMGAFAMQLFYPSFPYRREFCGFLEAANAGAGS